MVSDWIIDATYTLRGRVISLIYKNPPKHYLQFTVEKKIPIIIIPGILGKWGFLKNIADSLSLRGHPIYIIPELGYNLSSIPTAAKVIEGIITKKQLKNILIVGHSKGGLIGKYLLVKHNKKLNIKGLIAIASPFGGAPLAKLIPLSSFKELTPESQIIKYLNKNTKVNKKIVSIFPSWDNYLGRNSSHLAGAKNVKVNAYGHNAVLFKKETAYKVLGAIEYLSIK